MFDKVIEDIKYNYIKENNINYKKGDFKIAEITYDVNGILFMFLNSYYFEKLIDFKFVMDKNENNQDYYYIRSTGSKFSDELIRFDLSIEELNVVKDFYEKENLSAFKNLSLKNTFTTGEGVFNLSEIIEIFNVIPLKAYQNKIDVFKNEDSQYYETYYEEDDIDECKGFSPSYRKDFKEVNVKTNEKMLKTIEKLREDPCYSIIFELDNVKKLINLKNRTDFDFKLVDVIENDDIEIKKLSKLSEEYSVKNDLSEFYGLKYYPMARDDNFKAIVAYNKLELAGILSLVGPYEENIRKDSCFYLSYISVGQHFYGNNLGVRLAEKAIDYAIENKKVLFRTTPSKFGTRYIKDKITQMSLDKKFPLVSVEERNLSMLYLSKIKHLNNEDTYEKVFELLNYARNKYSQEDLDCFTISNKVIEDFEKLEKKVNYSFKKTSF